MGAHRVRGGQSGTASERALAATPTTRSGPPPPLRPRTPGDVTHLQRTVGNAATTRAVEEETGPSPADEALWADMFRLARKRIAVHDHAAAEELLRAIYAEPGFRTDVDPGVVINLGLVRHHQGDTAGAMAFYEEALLARSMAPEHRDLLLGQMRAARLGRPPAATATPEGEPGPDPADVALWDDMFALARKHLAAGALSDAEQLLRRIYGDAGFRSRDHPGVLVNLGLVRHRLGDHAGAISFYDESLDTGAWDADARAQVLLAVQAARRRRPPPAQGSEVRETDAADFALFDDTFRLARKRIAAGDLAEAERLLLTTYDDPAFRSSETPGVALNLGLVRHLLGDHASAISLYEESIRSDSWPADAKHQILTNLRLARLGQPPRSSKAADA